MQNTRYYCDICENEFPVFKLRQAHLFGRNMDFCEDCEKKLRVKFEELKGGNKNEC